LKKPTIPCKTCEKEECDKCEWLRSRARKWVKGPAPKTKISKILTEYSDLLGNLEKKIKLDISDFYIKYVEITRKLLRLLDEELGRLLGE